MILYVIASCAVTVPEPWVDTGATARLRWAVCVNGYIKERLFLCKARMFFHAGLVLCAALFAGAAAHTYTHTCHISPHARSVFSFSTKADCVHQRDALGAVVTPEIPLEEDARVKNSGSAACVYKSKTDTWTQTNAWAQYPRGLNLDRWQVDRRTSPIVLTFGRRTEPLACADGTECVDAELTCATTASAFCGGAVLGAWLSAVYFTYTRRNERRFT
jgi:hypothetical protein